MNVHLMAESLLDPVTMGIDAHRMHVYPARWTDELNPYWKPVLDRAIPTIGEPVEEVAHFRFINDQVEITMAPSLSTNQPVDTPATVDLIGHVGGFEPIDDSEAQGPQK